jgi:glycosyltransferase involved in cell wall biosynthesis
MKSTEALPQKILKNIPLNDEQNALQFCRALHRFLNSAVLDELYAGNEASLAAPAVLSIVVPVCNEEGNLRELCQRIHSALQDVENNYEIILVDDGSQDKSLACMQELEDSDTRIKVVELARNFGHQVALSAGIDYAVGQAVILMDGDLQDPPETLPQLVAKWREGFEVVYAIRQNRKENIFLRFTYMVFYRLLSWMANIHIPIDAGDFCIMDRKVVDVLTSMPEKTRFMRGIRSWVGMKQVGIFYEREARLTGRSKYTLSKLLYLAMDGLVSFSFVPLRVISVSGLIVSLLSIMLAIYYAVKKVLVGLNPPGFASLMVAIFFLSGIQLITIGVIGEYVGRIFIEVKNRPLYIVKRLMGFNR